MKKTPKKIKKKKLPTKRRLVLGSSADDNSNDVNDIIIPPTPTPPKKKKCFPASKVFDLKKKLRANNPGSKPWIEIVAKKEYLLVKSFCPLNAGNTLVSKTRRVAYPRPGQTLVLHDD